MGENPLKGELLSSGVDHEKVFEKHPEWDVKDYCRYWELDLRKICKKYGLLDTREKDDCGEGCKCKTLGGWYEIPKRKAI